MTALPRKITRRQCVDLEVPGGVLPVAPALAPIFLDLATRFHATVESLEWPGCWGWADRNIGRTSTPSKHWGGLAVDLNAPQHPQGVPVLRTFSRGQVSAVGAILARYDGLIEWGGTWDLPDTDGMHFQLRDGATLESVLALGARLGGAPSPGRPAPAAPTSWTGPDLTGRGLTLRGQAGGQPQGPHSNGPRVQSLQRWLNRVFPAYSRIVDDGWYGTETARVLAEFARRSGVRGADGLNIGPQLAAALHRAGFERAYGAALERVAGHRHRPARR